MPSTTDSMISEMAVVGEQFCFILSGYLLTFQDILECLFNCLSVCIVSSGGIKICSRKVGKIISLILFAVVPDHRKSLIDPLVPDEQHNGLYF